MSTNYSISESLLPGDYKPPKKLQPNHFYYIVIKVLGHYGIEDYLLQKSYSEWVSMRLKERLQLIQDLYCQYVWINPHTIVVQRYNIDGQYCKEEYEITYTIIARAINVRNRINKDVHQAVLNHIKS